MQARKSNHDAQTERDRRARAWSQGVEARTRDNAAGVLCAVPPQSVAKPYRDAWLDGYMGKAAP